MKTTNFSRFNLGLLSYIIAIAVVFGITLLSKTVSHFMLLTLLILALIPIFIDAVKDLLERKISTEFFLIFATAVSIAAHQEHAMIVVLLIMLIAKYIEKFISKKTDNAIENLIRLVPTDVTIQSEHQERTISLAQVHKGMHVVVKTGKQIPVDGVIIDGRASINESFLSGESIPKEKGPKDLVFAGTFVEAGSVIVLVQKVGSETYFGKISKLLEQAGQEKAKIVTFSNRAALIAVQILIVFIALVWIITGNLSLVATMLVFGSPIELTLVTPIAILAGTAAAFKSGILVKGSLALEQLASIDTLIFDKTGTLTVGEPKVVTIESVDSAYTPRDILTLAAMVEARSGHVLAKAILQEALAQKIAVPSPDDYESITGHGVIASYKNQRYLLGSEHFIEAPEHGNTTIPQNFLHSDPTTTPFYLMCDTMLCGKISVADTIRPDAKKIIADLRSAGIKKIMLLSGDKLAVAQHIASQLGIEDAYGEVAPDEKLTIIKELQKKGVSVAMIGDGINDAPALKQADVGIALGAMGMEPAIQAADIVLMTNDLHGIVFVYKLSRKIMALIKQNIFFGFILIHLFGISLALFGLVTPIQAALFHAISDIFILINSAKLITFSIKNHKT